MQYKSTTIPDQSITAAKISPQTGGTGAVITLGTPSTGNNLTSATGFIFAHGLPVIPQGCFVTITITTAFAGYDIGDKISFMTGNALYNSPTGLTFQADVTNVIIMPYDSTIHLLDKTTGVGALGSFVDFTVDFTPFYIG